MGLNRYGTMGQNAPVQYRTLPESAPSPGGLPCPFQRNPPPRLRIWTIALEGWAAPPSPLDRGGEERAGLANSLMSGSRLGTTSPSPMSPTRSAADKEHEVCSGPKRGLHGKLIEHLMTGCIFMTIVTSRRADERQHKQGKIKEILCKI